MGKIIITTNGETIIHELTHDAPTYKEMKDEWDKLNTMPKNTGTLIVGVKSGCLLIGKEVINKSIIQLIE